MVQLGWLVFALTSVSMLDVLVSKPGNPCIWHMDMSYITFFPQVSRIEAMQMEREDVSG